MDAFVSETRTENKTPEMTVEVLDREGNHVRHYKTPTGFHLDRYVALLHPAPYIMIYSFPHVATGHAFRVEVCEDDMARTLIETHLGTYVTDFMRDDL